MTARNPLSPGDPRHGTDNGWRNYKCRCDLCRIKHNDVTRQWRHTIQTRQAAQAAHNPPVLRPTPRRTYDPWKFDVNAAIARAADAAVWTAGPKKPTVTSSVA